MVRHGDHGRRRGGDGCDLLLKSGGATAEPSRSASSGPQSRVLVSSDAKPFGLDLLLGCALRSFHGRQDAADLPDRLALLWRDSRTSIERPRPMPLSAERRARAFFPEALLDGHRKTGQLVRVTREQRASV